MDSYAAYWQLLQLILLRPIRTRAACSCRHRISRYQIKKPKTANFIGIKYNSQSIFTSLSHSALENNASQLGRQDLFQGEGKKNLAENSQSLLKVWKLVYRRARWINPCHEKWQKRGDFITGVWEFPSALAARARCLICQALFIHRLWVTTGVWEFVGFCQVNQRSGRPGDWTTP